MVRYVETICVDGEKIINYCSEDDFNYSIYIGQKCKVIESSNCLVGVLSEIDEPENAFFLKLNNRKIKKIYCSDIEDIYCEEEIGTIEERTVQ